MLRPDQIGVGQDDGELVAAVAGQQIARAFDGLAHRPRHLDEAVVAGRVAVGVVECLEVVDVDHYQSERQPLTRRPTMLPCEILVEVAAVGDFGEGIEERQALEHSVGRGQLPVHCRQLLLLPRDQAPLLAVPRLAGVGDP